MPRILVMGGPAHGKSTVGKTIATILSRKYGAVPVLHMDDVFWYGEWEMTPVSKVRQQVAEFVIQDNWIVDGNYSMSRDLVLDYVDHVFVLRLPLPLVLWRLFWREFGRLYGFSLTPYSLPPKRVTHKQSEGFWKSYQILGEQTIRWNFSKHKQILSELVTNRIEHTVITSSSQLSSIYHRFLDE